MNGIYLRVAQGLKKKLVAPARFKKTHKRAKALGIDLNNSMLYVKRGNTYYRILFTRGRYPSHLGGRYYENIDLIPVLINKYKTT